MASGLADVTQVGLPDAPSGNGAGRDAGQRVRAGGRFISDRPAVLSDTEDVFGHRDYAMALRDAVLDAETGTTIGLFGPWGVGKSTILDTLGGLLRARCAFVLFDAWRYENDAFRREFLRDLAWELDEYLADYDAERELRDLDVDVAVQEEGGVKASAKQAIRAIPAVVLLVVALFLVGGVVASAPAGVTLSLVALMPLVGYLALRLENIIQVQSISLSKKRLEDPDRFARRFREMLGALRATRLVIAVDNLDRCAPDAAVELLSTIKTYLEPELHRPVRGPRGKGSPEPPEHAAPTVVFVVAADADALRRHLCAKAGLSNGTAEAAREARAYADEYLRKFFGVEVTLRPLLGDDVRDYVGRHLDPVVDRWLTDEFLREALPHLDSPEEYRKRQKQLIVAFASAGLRRNPRRVKQFANNLEMHLGVLRAREDAKRLVRPLSSNPALVAKLQLLEEEWPAVFSGLQRDESLMGRLTQATLTPDPDLLADLNLTDTDWALLASVLRNSRDVPGEDQIRGYLRLKLSVIEAALPDYEDFRHWVVLGAFEDLEQFLSTGAAAHRLDQYGERLAFILDEELRPGRVEAALNVIGAAVAIPTFRPWLPVVVRRAVDDGQVLKRIAPRSALAFAQAVDQLPPDSARRVVDALAETFLEVGDEDVAARQGVALALSSAVHVLPEHVRREALEPHLDDLGTALVGMRDRFAVYEPLLREMPGLLKPEIRDAARGALLNAKGVEGLRRMFVEADRTDDAAAAPLVLRHAARQPQLMSPDDAKSLLLSFSPLLTESADDEAVFRSVVDYLLSLVGALAQPPEEIGELDEVLVKLQTRRPEALLLMAALPIEDRDERIHEFVSEWGSETFVPFARRHPRVPQALRVALLDRAAQAAAQRLLAPDIIEEVRNLYDQRRLLAEFEFGAARKAVQAWRSAEPEHRRRIEDAFRARGGSGDIWNVVLSEPTEPDAAGPLRFEGELFGPAADPPNPEELSLDVVVTGTLARSDDGRVELEIHDIEFPPRSTVPRRPELDSNQRPTP